MAPHRIGEDWLIDRLDRFWPEHTAGFTRLLIVLRREFGGDLDALLILGAVATGSRGEGWREILLSDGRGRGNTHSATNTQSIAHVTGIPRESVRRKLAQLEAKGWVTRDGAGNWIPTAQAADDLRPATMATIAYLRTVFAAALEEPPSPAASPTSQSAGP
jgi:hypothetical protein